MTNMRYALSLYLTAAASISCRVGAKFSDWVIFPSPASFLSHPSFYCCRVTITITIIQLPETDCLLFLWSCYREGLQNPSHRFGLLGLSETPKRPICLVQTESSPNLSHTENWETIWENLGCLPESRIYKIQTHVRFRFEELRNSSET